MNRASLNDRSLSFDEVASGGGLYRAITGGQIYDFRHAELDALERSGALQVTLYTLFSFLGGFRGGEFLFSYLLVVSFCFVGKTYATFGATH